MNYYNRDANYQNYHSGPPLPSGGRQWQPSPVPFQSTGGMPTAWPNMPAHHVPTLHSAPPAIFRPPSTPPAMTTMTPEMAAARMFGEASTAAKSASKSIRLLRRKSTGSSAAPPGNPNQHEPFDLNSLQQEFRHRFHDEHHHDQPLPTPQQIAPTLPSIPTPDQHAMDELAKSLGITQAVATLRQTVTSAPTSVFGEAAGAAISILAVVSRGIRGAKINDVRARSLATHAVTLISYIVDTTQKRRREGKPLDRGLHNELNGLLKVLYDIESFLLAQNKRSRFSKAVTYKSDARKVDDKQETLSQALAEFQFRSSINDQDRIAHIDKRLQDIKQNMLTTRASSSTTHPIPLPSNFPYNNATSAQPRSRGGRPS